MSGRSPIDALLDQVDWRCTCCGEARCSCHDERVVDTCEVTICCADHCPCDACRENRYGGYQRVNWTGKQHFARVGAERTLCGARVGPPPHLWKHAMLAPGRRDDCRSCTAAWKRLEGTPDA